MNLQNKYCKGQKDTDHLLPSPAKAINPSLPEKPFVVGNSLSHNSVCWACIRVYAPLKMNLGAITQTDDSRPAWRRAFTDFPPILSPYASRSATFQMRVASPASIAGVTRKVW